MKLLKQWLGLEPKEIKQRRKESIALLKSCGFILRPMSVCHLCEEKTYSIHRTIMNRSLVGEEFPALSVPLGYLCPRCGTVGHYRDTSGNEYLVDDWVKIYKQA